MSGTYELAVGSLYAAVLMGIGCGLWAMNDLTGEGNRRREPALDEGTSGRTAPEWRSGNAAAIGVRALRLLGGYVLLSVMMAGLVVLPAYQDVRPPAAVLRAAVGPARRLAPWPD